MARKKQPIRLVIDTNVAHSSAENEDDSHGTSQVCRSFLLAVWNGNYHYVMSPEIRREWDKHRSRFTQKWRRAMKSKRRQAWVESDENPKLDETIVEYAPSDEVRTAMVKDSMLVNAALKTDKRDISLERRVRGHFRDLSKHYLPVGEIAWVNPTKDQEKPLGWLQNGAPAEESRLLKNYRP